MTAQDPSSPDAGSDQLQVEPEVEEASPQRGATPSGPSVDQGPEALAFDEAHHEALREGDLLREGHVSLNWNSIEGVEEYRLTDETGAVLYRGAFERAFVSGLPDGRHTFTLEALDAEGQVLATSERPAVVQVEHWPLEQALALFAVGFVVVVALVTVIITGAVRSRGSGASSSAPSPPEGT